MSTIAELFQASTGIAFFMLGAVLFYVGITFFKAERGRYYSAQRYAGGITSTMRGEQPVPESEGKRGFAFNPKLGKFTRKSTLSNEALKEVFD